MGKATILENKGEGLYRVTINYDRTRAEKQTARLQTEVNEIDAALPAMQAAIDSAVLDLDYSQQVLNAAVHTYQQDPTPENKTAVKTVQGGVNEALTQLRNARQAKSIAELRRTQSQKRIEFLQSNVTADRETDAWCADYSEELTGEVGTIEVGRVDRQEPILRPAGESGDGSSYQPQRDGQLQSVMSTTPAGAFWNYAMLPGAGRHRPRYRLGEITSLDTATGVADVALDPTTSSHQNLNINQSDVLADVPIQYLDCHAAVFELGDRVVVEFQNHDWSQPLIIGFEREPRACAYHGFLCDVAGTEKNVKWNDGWSARPVDISAGNIDWRGPEDTVLTWAGKSRYFEGNGVSMSQNIYQNGKLLYTAPADVTGAFISAGKLFFTTADEYHWSLSGPAFHLIKETLWVIRLDDLEAAPKSVLVMDHSSTWGTYTPSLPHNTAPWLFNASGTTGTSIRLAADEKYHRWHLSVDALNETASLTDMGAAIVGHTTNSYPVDTESEDSTARYRRVDRSLQCEAVFKLEDWDGNTLITGEYAYLRQTDLQYERADYKSYGIGEKFWEYTVDESITRMVEISRNGSPLLSEIFQDLTTHTNVWGLYKSLPGGSDGQSALVTAAAGQLTGEFWLAALDLRIGLAVASFRDHVTTSALEQNGYPAQEDFQSTGGAYDIRWRWKAVWGGSVRSDQSGIVSSGNIWSGGDVGATHYNEWTDRVKASGYFRPDLNAEYDNPIQPNYLHPSNLNDFVSYQEDLKFGITRVFLTEARIGAFYPGEPTRVLISSPVAADARGSEWTSAGSPYFFHLTDGNLETLGGGPVTEILVL